MLSEAKWKMKFSLKDTKVKKLYQGSSYLKKTIEDSDSIRFYSKQDVIRTSVNKLSGILQP